MCDTSTELVIKMKHSKARLKVCLLCFNKASKEIAKLSSHVHEQISKHIFSDFNVNDPRLPSAICNSCQSKLNRVAKGERQNTFDLEQLSRNIESLSRVSPRTETCSCLICKIAKASGAAARKITHEHRSKVGGPAAEPDLVIHDLCGRCLSPKYRGCSHSCNQTTLLNNILNVKLLGK